MFTQRVCVCVCVCVCVRDARSVCTCVCVRLKLNATFMPHSVESVLNRVIQQIETRSRKGGKGAANRSGSGRARKVSSKLNNFEFSPR